MKYVIIFDMDDTLYSEITYVYSGFRAVAKYLAPILDESQDNLFLLMNKYLEKNGRGKVFNNVLSFYGYKSSGLVEDCVKIYRSHNPYIKLSKDTLNLLSSLKKHPLYVVTDGNVSVQLKKAEVLCLHQYVKQVIPTYILGEDKGKPSPYWFNKIASIEKVVPSQIVYIGDNANKDFVGIKSLGFNTIRIRQGMFKDTIPSEDHEAAYVINDITELVTTLKVIWPNFQEVKI